MQCRHCNTGEQETQEHIETCSYFAKERETLNLEEGKDKLIFWRRVIYVLKCMKLQNKDLFDHRIGAVDPSAATTSEDLAVRQVHTYPVSDEEARIRGCEGPRTSAGVATSAWDMSGGEGISDHPPKRNVA